MATSSKYTVVFLGASAVGKTQLISWNRLSKARPKLPTYQETCEQEYIDTAFVDSRPCDVTYLDTGGHSKYEELLDDWIQRGDAFVLVYSVEDHTSFEKMQLLHQRVAALSPNKAHRTLVVANSVSGKPHDRKVPHEQCLEFAKSALSGKGLLVVETCSSTGSNVRGLFGTVLQILGDDCALISSKAEITSSRSNSTLQIADANTEENRVAESAQQPATSERLPIQPEARASPAAEVSEAKASPAAEVSLADLFRDTLMQMEQHLASLQRQLKAEREEREAYQSRSQVVHIV